MGIDKIIDTSAIIYSAYRSDSLSIALSIPDQFSVLNKLQILPACR